MKRPLGELRIIGGEWRSRRVSFDADAAVGLRATPDRVRQTLFDWLAPSIRDAKCLDLFAGSGALGLEALSRGAAHCTFVDSGTPQVRNIRAMLTQFKGSERATVVQADALRWLHAPTLPDSGQHGFEVVFLDPPYDSALLLKVLPLLPPLLTPQHHIYLEWCGTAPPLPTGFAWLKEKQAGQVSYGLVTFHTT